MSTPTLLRADSASSRYQPLIVVLVATCAGIVVDRYRPLAFGFWWCAAVVGWTLWLVAARRKCERLASVALCGAACAVGGAWEHASWRLFDGDDLATFATLDPRPIYVEGTVVEAPRVVEQQSEYDASRSESKTRFELAVEAVRDGDAWRRASGRTDVQIDDVVAGVAAGDRIRLLGRVARSPPPLNPLEFDFAEHYRSERKLCVVRAAKARAVTVAAPCDPWNLPARLSSLRRRGHERLMRYVSSAEAGFASALLLGYRDQLDRRENWAFFRTGTVHILSISGLHIGMLAVFLHWGLRVGWLGRTTALGVTMLITAAYVVVIDAEPPAVRAALTVVLVATAALTLRNPLGGNILSAAALFVLAMNPNDLFRAGPQLSFLAAAVLAWSATWQLGREDDRFHDAPKTRGERAREYARRFGWSFVRALLVSTAIFTVATPLVAHRFHIASPIALLLTPLVALPTAVALLFGFLSLTLGAIAPPTAPLLGWVCGESLAACEWLVHAAERVPHGWYWLPGPNAWQTGVFYALLAAWCLLLPGSRWRKLVAAAALAWGGATLVPHHSLPPDVAVRMTFVSVGHGLSVLVEERHGPTWLYDCGRFGAAERGAQQIAGVLWSRGLTRLDAIVISHLDADHYNGLPYILEQFRTSQVFLSTPAYESSESAAIAIRRTCADAGVPLAPISAGESLFTLEPSDVRLDVLHPPPEGVPGNDNARSITIDVTSHGRNVLLTGDLEGTGLDRLLVRPPTRYDVILAPHHGSARSNPPGLASWSRPTYVIVSGNEDRRGAVRRAFEAVGARLLETTSDGAVTVDIHHNGTLHVLTYREERERAQRRD